MNGTKKKGAKKFEEYYGRSYIPRITKVNDLIRKFGPYVNCQSCGAFLKVDHQGKSGKKQIMVKVECSKCGYKEGDLKIDYE